MTAHRFWRAVAGIVAASVVASCSSEPPAELVLYGGDGQSSLMDNVDSHFAIENGCLYLIEDAAPNRRFIPSFPAEVTKWDGDKIVVGETTVKLGQPVTANGGAIAREHFESPSACDSKLTPGWRVSAGLVPR